MHAAGEFDAATVRYLLDHGAQINLRDAKGQTVLGRLTPDEPGQPGVKDLLIERGVVR